VIHQHLDWLFVNGMEPLSSSTEPIPFSDHHAIWAAFRVARPATAPTDTAERRQ
jgi:hypothetical protein